MDKLQLFAQFSGGKKDAFGADITCVSVENRSHGVYKTVKLRVKMEYFSVCESCWDVGIIPPKQNFGGFKYFTKHPATEANQDTIYDIRICQPRRHLSASSDPRC